MSTLIKNGRVIDPANKRDGIFDILIENGKISKVAKDIKTTAKNIIDARDKIVTPGLIDMHVHLREPGREDIETVASGTAAAARGGITSILSMPNTYPAMDSRESIRALKKIIKKDSKVNVFISGAITKERAGEKMVDMKAMKKEEVLALTDDGNPVEKGDVMFSALKKAGENNLLLISHCEDKNLSKEGVVNEGITATKLGLRGIPRSAEYEFVKRDIELSKKAKAKLHIAHVSCRESVEAVEKAKKQGLKVTTEVTPHHFSLDENVCMNYDTRTKMNPPLRSAEDILVIKKALKNGTIDAIASDHAPHGKHEKEIEFENAAFGIIGLETSLALAIANLVDKKIITWTKLVELMSAAPAKILGLNKKGALSPGYDADITIIDPETEWVYTRNTIRSKSKNSPFINRRFKGKAVCTIVCGKIIYTD